ncbi:HECT domain-containing protein [Balamuthia mandrillaris]
MKLLTVIYNHADVFRANARRALFGDLLLRKHFFPLFLHWDFNVRNTFHQLLVYKMVRLKRSVLRQEGFRVGELARQKHQQQLQAQRTQSFTVDPEHNNDAFLYGELEDRLAMLQDQLRGTRHDLYPKELEVYVPAALSEYKRYLSYYFMWESEGNVTAPKLVPLSLLDRAAVRPQRASQPTHKTASSSSQTFVSSERKPLIDSAD